MTTISHRLSQELRIPSFTLTIGRLWLLGIQKSDLTILIRHPQERLKNVEAKSVPYPLQRTRNWRP